MSLQDTWCRKWPWTLWGLFYVWILECLLQSIAQGKRTAVKFYFSLLFHFICISLYCITVSKQMPTISSSDCFHKWSTQLKGFSQLWISRQETWSANRKLTAADEFLPVFHEVISSWISQFCVNLPLSLKDTWLSKWFVHWEQQCTHQCELLSVSARHLSPQNIWYTVCSNMIYHQCEVLNVYAKYLMLERTSSSGSR